MSMTRLYAPPSTSSMHGQRASRALPASRKAVDSAADRHFASQARRNLLGRCAPKRARARTEEFFECLVESADGSEAGRQRDLTHREMCLVQQLFSQMYAARQCDGDWRRPKILTEEPAQVPLANTNAFSERSYAAAAVKRPMLDQTECAIDRIG
jgi:hypothetical protein